MGVKRTETVWTVCEGTKKKNWKGKEERLWGGDKDNDKIKMELEK